MKGRDLLVTGSRSIKSRDIVFNVLDTFASELAKDKKEIKRLYHGGAVGVDSIAGAWAMANNIPVIVMRPDFKKWPVAKFRWKAYIVRDFQMVDAVDHVVAIWDGKSSGTRLTFEYAERKQKTLHVRVFKDV